MIACLRGEYTGEYKDPTAIIKTLRHHNCPSAVIDDVQRVLCIGAPASFNAVSSFENFKSYLDYGNHSSATSKPDIIEACITKEINLAYTIPLPSWLAVFVPNIHLSPLGLLERTGKKPRLIVDHSFEPVSISLSNPTPTHPSISVNRLHWVTTELPLAYGSTMMLHLIRIYNLRITYPNEIIYLFDDDISSAFRHVRYNPFVAGAFSYIANNTLLIPTSQTFGSNSSPSNYECLAQARACLSTSFSNPSHAHLLSKHKAYLDMVTWGHTKDIDPRCISTICIADNLNRGVLRDDGTPTNTKHYAYVDDTLYADIRKCLPQAQAASCEGCFTVFGELMPDIRPSPLSEEKFRATRCSPIRQQLGLIINTNTMCICIPEAKLAILADIISKRFHPHRNSITILEGAELLGNLDHLGSVIPWFRHVYSNIRASFNTCIRAVNKQIEQSEDYITALSQLDSYSGFELKNYLRFIARWKARTIYHHEGSSPTIFLTKDFKNDINLIRTLVEDRDLWITPIPHIIPRVHPYTAYCDSCMYGAGGFSTELGFFWHIYWPQHALPLDDQSSNRTTHINMLEYLAITITYAIAQRILRHNPTLASDTYPTILINSDNTTACRWATNTVASSSSITKHVARMACALQINARLGLHVQYIEGGLNIVADALSRLPVLTPFCSTNFELQLNAVLHAHPCLQNCSAYQLPPNLLSLITALLSPTAEELTLQWRRQGRQVIPVLPSISSGSSLLD